MTTKYLINKNIIIVTVSIITIVTLIILISLSFTKNEIVAQVNGEPIHKEELYSTLVNLYGHETLETLIINQAIQLEVEKENIVIPNEEIERELNEYMEAYGGEEMI